MKHQVPFGTIIPERVQLNLASEDEDTHCELFRFTIELR